MDKRQTGTVRPSASTSTPWKSIGPCSTCCAQLMSAGRHQLETTLLMGPCGVQESISHCAQLWQYHLCHGERGLVDDIRIGYRTRSYQVARKHITIAKASTTPTFTFSQNARCHVRGSSLSLTKRYSLRLRGLVEDRAPDDADNREGKP